jgi:hypothetical protein
MHFLTPVIRVKIKQDPNLLILFMGVNTIVKNEHMKDRDALPHSCHESEVTKQDQNFRDRNSSLHCFHISESSSRSLSDMMGCIYSLSSWK